MPPSDHSNKLLIFIFTAYPFFDDRADVDDIPSPSDPRDLPFRGCWHQLVEVLGHEVGTQRIMNPRHQVLQQDAKAGGEYIPPIQGQAEARFLQQKIELYQLQVLKVS